MDEFVRTNLVPLHYARMGVAQDEAEKKALVDAFNAEHADRWEDMASRKESLARLEEQVRKDAVSLYHTIPNASKTFLPGVTIRDTKVYSVNRAEALEWAKEHRVALRLDETAYKKQLEAGSGAPGAVSTETTAAIAQDLAPIIAAAEEADAQHGS